MYLVNLNCNLERNKVQKRFELAIYVLFDRGVWNIIGITRILMRAVRTRYRD